MSNDWIERIGWPRFFELIGLPFTKYHIDNWRGARNSLNASSLHPLLSRAAAKRFMRGKGEP